VKNDVLMVRYKGKIMPTAAKKTNFQNRLDTAKYILDLSYRLISHYDSKTNQLLVLIGFDFTVMSIALTFLFGSFSSVSGVIKIDELHNRLAGTNSFKWLAPIMNELQALGVPVRFSFVLTKELMENRQTVVEFINNLRYPSHIYFHRLMPVGRCLSGYIPGGKAVAAFAANIKNTITSRHNILFHHTINSQKCLAFKNRIFIDYTGNIYGCGWRTGANKAIANIHNTPVSDIIGNIPADISDAYICPLSTLKEK